MCNSVVSLLILLSLSAYAGEDVLHIQTYNVRGLYWPKNPDPARFQNIADLIRNRTQKPDVIVFQETFSAQSHSVFQESGYPYQLKPERRNLRPVSSGLHMMALHPLTDASHRRFQYCFFEECFAAKGIQAAFLQKPSLPFPVVILNTHMQAQSELQIYDWIRKRQIDLMQKFITQNGYKKYVIIFAGDFNIRPRLKSYSYFQKMFPDFVDVGRFCLDHSSCEILLPPPTEVSDVWQHTHDRQFFYAPAGSGIKIEPIQFSRTFSAPYREGKYLSDHWALEARYRLSWP